MTKSIEDWLSGLGAPSADRDYKPGHARMHALLSGMQLHRPRLRIRVAGTNGKGSTAHMLAAGLAAAGMNVGLYTSPHIHRFNERIQVNGREIPDAELLALLPSIVARAEDIGASYFEVATALALQCFSEARVDAEVLEAGVGARLDATTAVPADMALLTPVALDHQAWLGDTLAAIADEKAHVFDGCRWRLSAAQDVAVRAVVDGVTPDVQYVDAADELALAMNGRHQQQNAALALAALATLQSSGALPSDARTTADTRHAVAATTVPGRLQQENVGQQSFWLDAAHNRHAVEALLPAFKELNLDTIMVFTREDRDLRECIPLLRQCSRRVVGADDSVFDTAYPTIAEALNKETGKPDGRYLVLGSFITVAAAADWLASRSAASQAQKKALSGH